MTELSKIEKVDLREIWPHEAQDFTPWLAENINELSEELGMDLELQEQEAPVGGYSLDILAHDLGSNRPVIIENQLEGTNHDHLGKLLTYASGYDANVVVWIAREFRDEHRQALDWLNQRTDENTEFFGVIVELWKIDDSRPAVNFNLVSTPNEWLKENMSGKSQSGIATSERGERYRIFFQDLIDTLREEHKFTTARKALPTNTRDFTSGHSGVSYTTIFTWDDQAAVMVYIADNKNLFERLSEARVCIESEIGESLEWDSVDDRKACRILATRPGNINQDQQTLEQIQDWMVDRLLKFKGVFGPRLAELT